MSATESVLHPLEDAITLATEAHRGQVDKAGAAYILHPLRVMLHSPMMNAASPRSCTT